MAEHAVDVCACVEKCNLPYRICEIRGRTPKPECCLLRPYFLGLLWAPKVNPGLVYILAIVSDYCHGCVYGTNTFSCFTDHESLMASSRAFFFSKLV